MMFAEVVLCDVNVCVNTCAEVMFVCVRVRECVSRCLRLYSMCEGDFTEQYV